MIAKTAFLFASAAFFARGALSDLVVNNYCDEDVEIWIAKDGECELGNGGCLVDDFLPWKLEGGDGMTVWRHGWRGEGVSVKMAKADKEGILQFEYTLDERGLWWNLSDLDGAGPGLVGTPFRHDDVQATPSGNGSGVGTCVTILCVADEVCRDSYQHSDDPNTKWCPPDTGDMRFDLCVPKEKFWAEDSA